MNSRSLLLIFLITASCSIAAVQGHTVFGNNSTLNVEIDPSAGAGATGTLWTGGNMSIGENSIQVTRSDKHLVIYGSSAPLPPYARGPQWEAFYQQGASVFLHTGRAVQAR